MSDVLMRVWVAIASDDRHQGPYLLARTREGAMRLLEEEYGRPIEFHQSTLFPEHTVGSLRIHGLWVNFIVTTMDVHDV